MRSDSDQWLDDFLHRRYRYQDQGRSSRSISWPNAHFRPPPDIVRVRVVAPKPVSPLMNSFAQSRMGKMAHQRKADRMLRAAGFHFTRIDGANHNHYRNDNEVEVVVPGSPRSSSQDLQRIRDVIKKSLKKEEAMPTSTSNVTVVDRMVAMADPFLLKELPEDPDRLAIQARNQALAGWVRRVIEKHGPVSGNDLRAAAERIGFSHHHVTRARKDAGVLAFRAGGVKTAWLVGLDYQVPKNSAVYGASRSSNGVQTEAPEPQPEPSIENKAAGTAPLAGSGVSHLVADESGVTMRETPAASNGARKLTDQQAAALMLLESLGIHQPGDEAKRALENASKALDDAHAALSMALEALGA